MEEYWNNRFSEEGQVWGEKPSMTAQIALEYFKKHNIKSVFVPGASYGRNTKLFSSNGIKTAGIENSEIAYDLAQIFDPKSDIRLGSIYDLPLITQKYDAIYCLNVLHLFTEKNRHNVLKICADIVNPHAILFFVVFSDKEATFGKGKEIEPNTFESEPGHPIHYYSETDLKTQFQEFTILEFGLLEEKENHGKYGEHIHNLRYIIAKT
ncbi:class I SAM-dependent methyltransferase [Promethearchaeum syntrophicum]|uniref:Class I SAM-dependent methyltransferase n=1 Tax=Promethearchaeum syntrophicum TaxID=2594042 RepID=A0A5B9DG54_9ARCH|nr:class I SAM-dependent methyltransferase [Candidatus Prometheoarchaeum syntrophicum]QEE18001.1 Methyltransferase domain protein [Candidatus Prometheoarchaeum syntrophicum]